MLYETHANDSSQLEIGDRGLLSSYDSGVRQYTVVLVAGQQLWRRRE
jgi:hypothetical protein